MAQPVYVALFAGAILYALGVGFGERLFSDSPSSAPDAALRPSRGPIFAAFAAGFGGSGALLHAAHRLSPLAEVAAAIVAGALFAAFLHAVVNGSLLRDP